MTQQKKDRRVRRTRAALREALLELIVEQGGYDALTVQDILDRADVGRSTFYAHYMNKDDLLAGDMPKSMLTFDKADPASLVPSVTFLFAHTRDHYDLFKAMVGSQGYLLVLSKWRERMGADWRARIEAVQAAGRPFPVPADVVACDLSGALMALLTWWLDARMPYPPEAMNDMFHRLTRQGLDALQHPE
jgi:AcrR family transcriptional regulator